MTRVDSSTTLRMTLPWQCDYILLERRRVGGSEDLLSERPDAVDSTLLMNMLRSVASTTSLTNTTGEE